MTENQTAILKISIRNGFGFTISCTNAGLEPKSVSDLVNDDKVFLDELTMEAKKGASMLLSLINNSLAELKLSEWEQRKAKFRDFITEIHLWESFSTKAGITPEKVIRAFNTYPIEDVPTTVGLTKLELINYVFEDDGLFYFAQEIGYIK